MCVHVKLTGLDSSVYCVEKGQWISQWDNPILSLNQLHAADFSQIQGAKVWKANKYSSSHINKPPRWLISPAERYSPQNVVLNSACDDLPTEIRHFDQMIKRLKDPDFTPLAMVDCTRPQFSLGTAFG